MWCFSYVHPGIARGQCLDIDGDTGVHIVPCIKTAHNDTDVYGQRYTDGINGEHGGKQKWLSCLSECEDEDK